MADKKSKDKAAKGKDKGKGKGEASTDVLRVAAHPFAARSVRTAKGWGGLLGFVIVFVLSHRTGVVFYWSAIRAVLGGIAGYVVAWMFAVTMWRELLVARVEAARQEAIAQGELSES